MKLHKTIAFLTAFLMLFSLVACRERQGAYSEEHPLPLPEESHSPLPGETGVSFPSLSPKPPVSSTASEAGSPGENGERKACFQKGIWLSQFDLAQIYLQGNTQREKKDFTEKLGRILKEIREMGFDAVLLQVHPYGDSFYDSAFFPASRFITGAYGKEAAYDPLRVAEELCAKLGLSLHAWINPMRLMTEKEILQLPADSLLRTWYEKKSGEISAVNGRCYLDPAYPQVRELVVSAARELCEKYAIDGVHIDDYFYPTQEESFDSKSYASYLERGGSLSLGDFRRDRLSLLVSELYAACHARGKLFGISPAGNSNNVYESMYADVYRWCREKGFCDYLCPQVYFGFEHQSLPFAACCESWYELCRESEGKLIIGLTFTKAGLAEDPYAGTGREEWAKHHDIISRSARYVAEAGHFGGICVFSYSYLSDPLTGERPSRSAQEAEAFLKLLPDLSF